MLAFVTIVVSVLVIGSNAWFWALALRGFLAWRRAAARPDPPAWPHAHVFVCLKGKLPRLAQTVEALAGQDYAGPYRVTFITEASAAHGDEAAAGLARCLPPHGRCDHVVAGRVIERGARCAQKNYNLLAGIRHAEESFPEAEIYAFCDGDLLVKPSWLTEMVRPVAVGVSEVSTSFHWVAAEGRRIIAALHGLAEAAQSMAALVCRGATWGGSMAIRASVFRDRRLRETWGRTVVDDMALSRDVKRLRLRVAPVPRFLVQSESSITNYRGFVHWLGRQYFFVKVYQPSLYRLLWAKTAIDVTCLWLAAYQAAYRVALGEWPAGTGLGLLSLLDAGAILASLHLFRYLLPERPSARLWASASLLAPGSSLLACAGAALRRRRLVWSDLSYEVEPDGRVSGVARAAGVALERDEGLATEAA